MTKKNYILRYTAIDINRYPVKRGNMRVRNSINELDAKVRLEAYLKKKYPGVDKLIVYACKKENYFTSIFGDIFRSNPFGH